MNGVFKDESRLSYGYVPERLPHRETQLQELLDRSKIIFEEKAVRSLRFHMQGPVGVGKTALAKRFGEHIQKDGEKRGVNTSYIHVNLNYCPGSFQVMQEILRGSASGGLKERGLKAEEMLRVLADLLEKERRQLFIALDEVDTYIAEGREEKVLYQLSRIHERSHEVNPRFNIHLILIYRDESWLRRLEETTRQTLFGFAVSLEQYQLVQLREILKYRASEAFQPNTISDEVVGFVADLAEKNGGVRYGLELMTGAGYIANSRSASKIIPEYVRITHDNIPKGTAYGLFDLTVLSIHKQLIVRAIYQRLSRLGEPYLSLKDAYEDYRVRCEAQNVVSDSVKAFKSNLESLSKEGFILLKEETGTVHIGSEHSSEKVAATIEKNLKGCHRPRI